MRITPHRSSIKNKSEKTIEGVGLGVLSNVFIQGLI
jgi:hypothetical protein